MTTAILGLKKPIEDTQTGAPIYYHVLRAYQVDVVAQRTLVTLSSYISQAARAAGKNPISAISVSGLIGVPGADPVQWCYQALLAEGSDANVLAGAEPVYAEPAVDDGVSP